MLHLRVQGAACPPNVMPAYAYRQIVQTLITPFMLFCYINQTPGPGGLGLQFSTKKKRRIEEEQSLNSKEF